MTLARGARQLVVQDALDTTFILGLYLFWLTPITNIGASAEGAEITTFCAPPVWCLEAPSRVVNTPVDSTTYLAPALAQSMAAGSLSENTVMTCPSITSLPSSCFTSPLYWP